jgi:hypothetical protein
MMFRFLVKIIWKNDRKISKTTKTQLRLFD